MEEKKKMSLQMQKAILLAFQKCIAEEIDIKEIFDSFEIVDSDDGLVVLNPPIFKVVKKEESE